MVLKAKHRSTLTEAFTELVHDEEAVEDLLAQFPVREADEPITKDFLRAELAELRSDLTGEFHGEFATFARSIITWMIAIVGIAVTILAVLLGLAVNHLS